MALDGGDLLGLYDETDPALAGAKARAIGRRAQGLQDAGLLMRVLAGDQDPTGGILSAQGQHEADQLAGAEQHAAQIGVQRQHFANDAAWRAAMLGVRGREADTHARDADTRAELAGMKAGETMVTRDMWGNPVTVKKYPDGIVRPLTLSQPGSAPAPDGSAPPPAPAPKRLSTPGRAPAPAPAPAAAPGGGPPPPAIPAGANMTPEAFDQAAEEAYRTGKFGSYGRATGAMTVALRQRISQLHPGADLASTHGEYTADAASLKQQQRLLDLTKSWEATGKANLGKLREVAGQLADTGSPWFNKPLRTFLEGATGDPRQTAFKAAHNAVVNEYAKILSGSTGGGGVTEGARHEAESMIPLSSTPTQIAAAADILETDAGNRLGALSAQVEATRKRMGAKGAPTPPPAAAPAPDATAALRAKYKL